VIIGGAPGHITACGVRAAALGIGGRVHLLGPRPVTALGSYLRQATIVVSPRVKGQNTPMKVYSYLDSGAPLLATRLPTHTQVLDDDIAMLAEPQPEAFGEALATLLNDNALRLRIATAARERVTREFTREAFRRKMGAFYATVERELAASTRKVA
jgi:glycosyltransferase involved in cell wall biosynthesis